MNRELRFTAEAESNLRALQGRSATRGLLQQVRKTLGLLESNLRHPSLETHEFHSLQGVNGETVFVAYVQNRTPGAFRVFFHYGPDRTDRGRRIAVLTIIAITAHP